MCAGATEHVITTTTLRLAMPTDPDRAVCVRAHVTNPTPMPYDARREVVRVGQASADEWVCDDHPDVEIWPAIDTPSSVELMLETASCSPKGCVDGDVHSLTSVPLSVPVTSTSDLLTPQPDANDSIACADLDGNGTPELLLAYAPSSGGLGEMHADVGAAGRFTNYSDTTPTHPHALLGFMWKSDTGNVPVVLGVSGSATVRAQVASNSTIAWADATAFDPQVPPNFAIPIGPTRSAATYLASISGGVLNLHCISAGCSNTGMTQIPLGAQLQTIGVADVDGDGDSDLVVAFGDDINVQGHPAVHIKTITLAWTGDAITSASPSGILATFEGVGGGASAIVGIPDGDRDRLYVLAGSLVELTFNMSAYATTTVSAIGNPIAIAAVDTPTHDRALAVATSLGVFTYVHANTTNPEWHLQDPLIAEQSGGQTFVDNAQIRYADAFTPCLSTSSGLSSLAFQLKRGTFEWTELDLPVDTF